MNIAVIIEMALIRAVQRGVLRPLTVWTLDSLGRTVGICLVRAIIGCLLIKQILLICSLLRSKTAVVWNVHFISRLE